MRTLKGKIAVIPAVGMGDGLIYMTLVHHLIRSGYEVTTFHNGLAQLKEWFPGKQIEPYPFENRKERLREFGTIIDGHQHFLPLIPELQEKKIVIDRSSFDRTQTRVANLAQYCRRHFGCESATVENGMKAPSSRVFRKHQTRVAIHPTSNKPIQTWFQEKFIRLARRLRKEGYEPVFSVSPAERPQWQEKLQGEFELPRFASLNELAGFFYESGYFIGNDSGPGHLASNLGIPGVILFYKKNRSLRWRPGWAEVEIALPTLRLPGSKIHKKFWRELLTVGRVLSCFKKQVRRNSRAKC